MRSLPHGFHRPAVRDVARVDVASPLWGDPGREGTPHTGCSCKEHASALQSSVLFRGGRPRPLVAVVPTRTRSNCVTARWGGKQRMRTRSTAMTSEHDSASIAATSLLGTGEVCWRKVRQSLRKYTDARKMPIGVVDGSRSGKEDAGECRRSVRVRPSQRRLTEVRAAIGAEKRGNACGAKGGREANVRRK
jgi:hypothetical protein